jgi:hypothetical protein
VVLEGQLCGVLQRPAAVEALHRLGDPAVQAHLPGWAQFGVKRVPE